MKQLKVSYSISLVCAIVCILGIMLDSSNYLNYIFAIYNLANLILIQKLMDKVELAEVKVRVNKPPKNNINR